jgi:very-short-patch-repair endonuclease
VPSKQLKLSAELWPDLALEAGVPKGDSSKTEAADHFARQIGMVPNLVAEREHQFAKAKMQRNWAFDFCFRQYMVAVEIEGMAVQLRCPKCFGHELIIRGRHGSIGGINEDMVKYNSAALLGWTVLRFATKDVKPRRAYDMTMLVLAARGWQMPA